MPNKHIDNPDKHTPLPSQAPYWYSLTSQLLGLTLMHISWVLKLLSPRYALDSPFSQRFAKVGLGFEVRLGIVLEG